MHLQLIYCPAMHLQFYEFGDSNYLLILSDRCAKITTAFLL